MKPMSKRSYRAAYIKEMMEQAKLSEAEATECYEAITEDDLRIFQAAGEPAYDVSEEISYWEA